MTPDTGDMVLHVPTGYDWQVGWTDGDRVIDAGYPHFAYYLGDCRVTQKATARERRRLLRTLLSQAPTNKFAVVRARVADLPWIERLLLRVGL